MNSFIDLAKSKGLDLEVTKCVNKSFCIEIFDGSIDKYIINDVDSYSIKALINDKMVSINSEILSDCLIDELYDIAELSDNTDTDLFSSNSIIGDSLVTNNISNTDIDIIIDRINILLPKVKNIGVYIYGSGTEREILNTSDVHLLDSNFNYDYSFEVITDDNTKYISRCVNELNIDDILYDLEELVDYTINSSNKSSIGNYGGKVLLRNNVVNAIFNSFYSHFSAYNINKGLSLFGSSFNDVIASSKLSVIEDPLNKELPGSYLFDYEGVNSTYKKIIDNGKFSSKFYNNKEAIKDKVESTGNGSIVSNIYIDKGDSTYQELVNELDFGIIVKDVIGVHSGINSVSGDISLEFSGEYICNGVTKYINQVIMNVNFKDLMKNILLVGNDLVFFNEKSGAVSLLIDKVSVTGNEGSN